MSTMTEALKRAREAATRLHDKAALALGSATDCGLLSALNDVERAAATFSERFAVVNDDNDGLAAKVASLEAALLNIEATVAGCPGMDVSDDVLAIARAALRGGGK